MKEDKQSLQLKWVKKLVQIKPNEVAAAVLSFVFLFCLMVAYFILKPLRDAQVSDWSDAELSSVWTITFLFSLFAVSAYSALVSRINFRILVPALYFTFALVFLLFYFLTISDSGNEDIQKAFYIWMSLFALFHLSVFWSFMSDLFNPEQATRLFAFIATGSSLGAIVGPSIAVLFTSQLGLSNLLLIATILLLIPVPIIIYLENQKRRSILDQDHHLEPAELNLIGGNVLSGFKALFQNHYLLLIALFVLLYASIGSFIYFHIKNLLAVYDEESRAQIWAGIDLSVNILSVLTAWFATSRIVNRFGLALTLSLMPVVMIFGLLTLSLFPLVSIAMTVQAIRRAGNYAITQPAREMLFTKVSRQDRFKSKPVIDIVVYRGADMVSGWVFTGLTQGLNFGLSAVAVVGALIAAGWAAISIPLGKRYDNLPQSSSAAAIIVDSDEAGHL